MFKSRGSRIVLLCLWTLAVWATAWEMAANLTRATYVSPGSSTTKPPAGRPPPMRDPAYLASLTAEDKQALADVVKTVFPTGGSRCGDYAITNIALQSLGEGWGTRLMGDVTTIGPRPATITMEIHVYDLTGRAVDVASFHAENLKPGELRPFWVWFPQARPQDIHTLRTSLVSEQ